jgi:hypothetical protein
MLRASVIHTENEKFIISLRKPEDKDIFDFVGGKKSIKVEHKVRS